MDGFTALVAELSYTTSPQCAVSERFFLMVGQDAWAGAPFGPGSVLSALRRMGPCTITEITAELGLARSTTIARLTALVDAGMVTSREGSGGLRGRPASVFEFHPRAAFVLVAQIGLSAARLAVADLDGTFLSSDYVDVDLSIGSHEIAKHMAERFAALLKDLDLTDHPVIAGIGLALPSTTETLDYARSIGESLLEWSPDSFRDVMKARFGAPVFIDRDVNFLGLSERHNSWPNVETLVCVKLGTLIDSSIIVNGVALKGADGIAGGFGHAKVSGSTESCTCGGVGCLDAVASGSALVRRLQQEGLAVTHVADVIALATGGHPVVLQSIREAGRSIGEALSAVVNLLNPEVVAFTGYLTGAESTLFAGIRQGLYENALPAASARLQLAMPDLGDAAGISGAAMHVIDRVLDSESVDATLAAGSWLHGTPTDAPQVVATAG